MNDLDYEIITGRLYDEGLIRNMEYDKKLPIILPSIYENIIFILQKNMIQIGHIKNFKRKVLKFKLHKEYDDEYNIGNMKNVQIEVITNTGNYKKRIFLPEGYDIHDNKKSQCYFQKDRKKIFIDFQFIYTVFSNQEIYKIQHPQLNIDDTLFVEMEFMKNFDKETCEIIYASFFNETNMNQMQRVSDYVIEEFKSLYMELGKQGYMSEEI